MEKCCSNRLEQSSHILSSECLGVGRVAVSVSGTRWVRSWEKVGSRGGDKVGAWWPPTGGIGYGEVVVEVVEM
jgi:hypothetical protein